MSARELRDWELWFLLKEDERAAQRLDAKGKASLQRLMRS